MIASFSAFGLSEWTTRLGPAISGLLTLAAVYWLGCCGESRTSSGENQWRPGRGIFSALIAASSAGLIAFSRGASFDILITTSVTFSLAFFLASETEQDEGRRRWFLAGFYCLVGISLLAKGLVGIVIPFGVLVAYFGLRWKLPDRLPIKSLLWGGPLALFVALTWYGPVIETVGLLSINFLFSIISHASFQTNIIIPSPSISICR